MRGQSFALQPGIDQRPGSPVEDSTLEFKRLRPDESKQLDVRDVLRISYKWSDFSRNWRDTVLFKCRILREC